jgi:hypothetical protein
MAGGGAWAVEEGGGGVELLSHPGSDAAPFAAGGLATRPGPLDAACTAGSCSVCNSHNCEIVQAVWMMDSSYA